MAIFSYKATDGELSAMAGTIIADTPRQARDILRDRGLSVQEVSAHRSSIGRSKLVELMQTRFGRKHKSKTAAFIREMATLVGVGIPLLEAIDTIAKQHDGDFRTVLLFLKDEISAGVSLADAMRQRPDVFDALSVNIVEVGQHTGALDTALLRLAEFQDKSRQFKDRIGTALIYPCIVLSMSICVSIFLMTVVIPNLLKALVQQGRPLPWATRVVKGGSDLLLDKWWLILIVSTLVIVGVGALLRTKTGRYTWHRLILKLPVLGNLIRKQAIVRAVTVIAALLKSGIVFDRAIQIAQQSTRNMVLRKALADCETAIHGGTDIADALQRTEVFPPTAVQIFAVGQKSGKLEEMLERLAHDYDAQVQIASSRLTAVLEPALILLMVFVVGLIAFATVLPILEASNAV